MNVCIDCGYPHDWCYRCSQCMCDCSCYDDWLAGVSNLYPDERGQRARWSRPVHTVTVSPGLL